MALDVEKIVLSLNAPYEQNGPILPEFQNLLNQFLECGNEENEIKFVYCCAGLALYLAHCFEKSLVTVLFLERIATSETNRTPANKKALDELEGDLDRKTCGTLLKKVREKVEIDTTGIALLNIALESRNDIAHHFFIETLHYFQFMREGRRWFKNLRGLQISCQRRINLLFA